MKYKLFLVLFLAVVLLAGTPMVSARSSFMSSFNQYYDTGDTKLDSCAICHTGSNGGGSLNSYGRAYSVSGRNYASIETLDSDGDGFSNLDEIDALTFPGNPNDYPETATENEAVTEIISETTDNATETQVYESVNNQSMEEPIVDETQEETTTEEQSPGFEAIIAFACVIAVVCLKRKE